MNTTDFPFAAMVGQPRLKLALLLAAVDWRLSVLLKGDKGSGKSTAARGLAEILPAAAPFVNLPIGATEDRLLGGLHLDRALHGEAALQPGLIQQAHGGVLYIDEVNLLADALTDALLDVASGARHYVERDGFSAAVEARFILLGSMNGEEGALRPQLLDRFALALDVEAPAAVGERAAILRERARFDADPARYRAGVEAEQQRLREAILAARGAVPSIQASDEVLLAVSRAVADAGVRSLRADLATLRAATAHAALAGRDEIVLDDIAAVLPLALHHRARPGAPPGPPPPPRRPDSATGPAPQSPADTESSAPDASSRLFPPDAGAAPGLRLQLDAALARGRSAASREPRDIAVTSGAAPNGERIDAAASLSTAFRKTGAAVLHPDHLVFKSPQPRSGARFIFVVDASGSHAVQQRMRAVKGAVCALLASSLEARDEVAVVAFRGPRAHIVLEPCRDAEAARRALEFLPTGGRTPMAHALELTASLLTPASVVVLLTDGHANVALSGDAPGDAWADALQAARRLPCAVILVDSSIGPPNEAMTALAGALRAETIRLDAFNESAWLHVRSRAPSAGRGSWETP